MKHLLFVLLFLTLLSCSRRETIFINNVQQSREKLRKLDSSDIFSYTKYDPGTAPSSYYKGTDTTVIVIKTKESETRLQKQRHALLNRFLDSVDNGVDILIVQDGIMIMQDAQKNLRLLSPDKLSNADTMEWKAAKRLYGSPARPITLIINLYDPF
jgi:hypothetical protein